MKELRLRAYLKNLAKIVEVVSIEFYKESFVSSLKRLDTGEHLGKFNSEECILIQSSGIKDICGKDIYEGDILKVTGLFSEWIEVIFEDGVFSFMNGRPLRDLPVSHLMEIVGNVLVEKDLLKCLAFNEAIVSGLNTIKRINHE